MKGAFKYVLYTLWLHLNSTTQKINLKNKFVEKKDDEKYLSIFLFFIQHTATNSIKHNNVHISYKLTVVIFMNI